MPNTAERLLADIQQLAPNIAARAAEIEAEGQFPPDLVESLRSIGAFRMFAPQSHGGLELDLPVAIKIITSLCKIDGSVGWNVATCNGGHLFASLLPRQTYEQLYDNGPNMISGSNQPVGMAEATDGGWRVNGRWPFASGCQYASWMFAFCIMTEGGKPLPGPDGEAEVHHRLVRA